MNEVNEDPARSVQSGKRRRIQGSCDRCKKRKGTAEMPSNRCTNCITSHSECTHTVRIVPQSPSAPAQTRRNDISPSPVYVPLNDSDTSHKICLEEKLAALQPQHLFRPPHCVDNASSLRTSESGALVDTDEPFPIQDALRAGVQRPEFWSTQSWEKLTIERSHLIFPDNDLLKALIKIYFEQINPILSILHFPSFHQSISDGLHFRDSHLAPHSDDPRVFLDGANSEHSCGWKWFRQVRPLRVSFSPEPSLYEPALICLSAIYLAGTSTPEESWILTGLGFVDQASQQPVDFDLDLPVACDDEYWGIPDAVQPAEKPSTSAFMPAYIELMLIFARYSTGCVLHWNQWVDGIPEHLRWDPNQQNQIFLDQSTTLFATYYHAQILIHRPFIPAPGKESTSKANFPTLAICANAARSCGHVLDVQSRRGRGLLHYPGLMTALSDCAVVLLVNVWAIVDGRKPRTPEDFTRATADAQNCVRVLRLYERRWRVAGRKCDIIDALLHLGKHTSNAHLKRLRDEEDVSAPPNVPEISVHPAEVPITDSSDSVAHQMQALERSIEETGHLFSLPLHTEELGRLPVYDSFDYEFTFNSKDIHYQPTLTPQFLHSVDPALDSIFPMQTETSGLGDVQLPPVSFDIPLGDGWRDWSRYLARDFFESRLITDELCN
ncbi:hypothetical protein B0H13DRAFT_2120011 [Mycena leptocephala]|nr:hypothetical protein B0H13DRAFT_2120011 [Mycena leptocephala]